MARQVRSTELELVPQIALSDQTAVPQIALQAESWFAVVPQMAFVPQIARRSVTPVPQIAFVPQMALSRLMTTLPFASCESDGLMAYCVATAVDFRALTIFMYPAPYVHGSEFPAESTMSSADIIIR